MLNACRQLMFQANEQIEESTTHEGGKKIEVFNSENLYILQIFNPLVFSSKFKNVLF